MNCQGELSKKRLFISVEFGKELNKYIEKEEKQEQLRLPEFTSITLKR